MKTLKEWLGFCVHKWSLIDTIPVTSNYDGGHYYDDYILKCTKCGTVKKKRL